MNKIIASVTTFPKRINCLIKSLQFFAEKQTIKPDIFYIWLAKDEFKNDTVLPIQFLELINKYKFFKVKWIDKSQRSYNKWLVYPEHILDYVAIFDDDCYYSPNILENSLNVLKSYKNSICNFWWQFTAIPIYNNEIKYKFQFSNHICDIRHWLCAQCMIPPKIFPLDSITEDVIFYRNKFANGNDEAWIIPYLLKHDIPVSYVEINYPYKTIDDSQLYSLVQTNSKNTNNGYSPTEMALYYMLKKADMLDKYSKIFKNYNYKFFKEKFDT